MMRVMRYPAWHKQVVRSRIVHAAAEAFRRHGLGGIGIPALMRRAGLTHGGFYTHFPSRDQLVVEAILLAAQQTADGALADGLPLDETLRRYLSKEHLASPAGGCVLAAFGNEAQRQPARVRRTLAEVARHFLHLIDRKLHPGTRPEAQAVSDAALATSALMLGAVVLGRLVQEEALAERILAAARQAARPPGAAQ